MTQEEKFIREHDNGRNPFVVPEGYFENFTSRMMDRVKSEGLMTSETPATPHTAVKLQLWQKWLRYAAVAAIVVASFAGGWFFYQQPARNDVGEQFVAQGDQGDFYYTDDDLDAALDYELVDNDQIAYYLTEAY